jgi:hypothetical protein
MKKTIAMLLVLFVAMVLVSGCLETKSQIDQDGGDDSTPADTTPATVSGSEEDRYAKLNAEVACNLLEDPEGNAAKTITDFPDTASKYGFTAEELDALLTKYENDDAFKQKIQDEMSDMCPDVLAGLGA